MACVGRLEVVCFVFFKETDHEPKKRDRDLFCIAALQLSKETANDQTGVCIGEIEMRHSPLKLGTSTPRDPSAF